MGSVSRLSHEDQVKLADGAHVKAAGVKQGEDVLAWLWDNKFVSWHANQNMSLHDF